MPSSSSASDPARGTATVYRPALDGIRAVAIASVIAYHFGYRWAPGGFLGVDIFFVLSGYLITHLLLAEHARTGRIALRAFWLHRARRLLPALFLMLAVVAAWTSATGSPFETNMRRDDLLWTILYGSNWHFVLTDQDYFAQYASVSALRHTWSLAIEEQFYLVWPILVGAALWLGRKRSVAVGLLCVAGIVGSAAAMAIIADPLDPSRAYYGTDTRAHQLLIGALLAVLMSRRNQMAQLGRLASVVAPAATLLLLAAFATVQDQGAAYYHGLSILVALAAAALIWAVEVNPTQVVARALSLPPMTWIGRISYGLYLWHWPVILMVTTPVTILAWMPGATTAINVTRLLIIFGIEIVSFYLLERPVRLGKMPLVGQSARRFSAVAIAVPIAIFGSTLAWTAATVPASAVPAPETTYLHGCPAFTLCVRHQGPAGAPVLGVIGDSVARSLDPAFQALATEHGWTYVLAADNGCRVGHLVVADVSPQNSRDLPNCWAKTSGQQDNLVATWHPDLIVMVDYMETLAVRDAGGTRFERGSPEAVAMSEDALREVALRITKTGSKLTIVEIPPRLGKECQTPANIKTADCTFRFSGFGRAPEAPYNAMYEHLAQNTPGVSAISITPAVCPNNFCTPAIDGVYTRYDGLHYTVEGAMKVMPALGRAILSTGAIR